MYPSRIFAPGARFDSSAASSIAVRIGFPSTALITFPTRKLAFLARSHGTKNVLALLSEFGLPLTYLDEVLSSDDFRGKLLSRSKNPPVRDYFERHLRKEGQQTIAALRARMETLFASEGVRLALSGTSAPDFRTLQNEGKIVLVNCSGPTITRGVRLLLQGLVLSDIRQSLFAIMISLSGLKLIVSSFPPWSFLATN